MINMQQHIVSSIKKPQSSGGYPERFFVLLECGHIQVLPSNLTTRTNDTTLNYLIPDKIIENKTIHENNFPVIRCNKCYRGEPPVFPSNFLKTFIKTINTNHFIPHICENCGKVVVSRMSVHSQGDSTNPKGWRWICCECLGHPYQSCHNVKAIE